jgi:hypothetical protein
MIVGFQVSSWIVLTFPPATSSWAASEVQVASVSPICLSSHAGGRQVEVVILQSLFPVAMRRAPVGTLYSVERSSHCCVMFAYADAPDSNCLCLIFAGVIDWPVQVGTAVLEVAVAVIEADVYEVGADKLTFESFPHHSRILTSSTPR